MNIPKTITRKHLKRTHPDFDAHFYKLRFHRETYEGSGGYAPYLDPVTIGDKAPDDMAKGYYTGPSDETRTYLFKHPREREKFRRRCMMAYNTNVVRRVLQMLVGYLTKSQPNYSKYPKPVGDWMGYCTSAGDTWEDWKISELLPRALYYGALPIIIFRSPTPEAETRAQQEALGGRLQVAAIDPESIIDWRMGPSAQYEWLKVLEMVDLSGPLDEERQLVKRYWYHTQEAWWYVDDPEETAGDGAEVPVTAWGRYENGMPIVIWRIGTASQSVIGDAAPTQRELFNVNSLIQEQERETAFAMLAAPSEGNHVKPGTKKTGVDNVWWYPPDARIAPHWMAPPTTILEHFMGKHKSLCEQILEDMGLDFDSSGASTGMAFQFAMSKIVRYLNLLATSLQRAEAQTMERVALELGIELPDDARCTWPSEFDAKDGEKVITMLEIILDRVASPVFRSEAQYRMAIAAMPDLDEKLRNEGRKEIEEAEAEGNMGRDEQPDDEDRRPPPKSEGDGDGIPDGEAL